jgi:hypothetical protein
MKRNGGFLYFAHARTLKTLFSESSQIEKVTFLYLIYMKCPEKSNTDATCCLGSDKGGNLDE